MSNIKKHVGKVKSTDKRCVVVFMQLPDNKHKALIIDVEALQPRYEQILLAVVDSAEGQQENDLAAAMARRTVQETGRTVLEEFHNLGLMRTEPISNIIMMPRPNTPFPLVDILEQLGRLSDAVVAPVVENDNSEVKYNPIVSNMNAADEEKRQQMAMNFIAEADMLDQEAAKKREQAYQYAPELRPKQRKVVHIDTGNQTPAQALATVAAEISGASPVKRGRGRPAKAASNG